MSASEDVFSVPDMSNDARIRVFRRYFAAQGAFDGMEVDAYVVITERYAIVCDTLICPEDVAVMIQAVQQDLAGRQVLVVNSHADWDHYWGNCYFTGTRSAPIIAHEHSLTRILEEESKTELADYQKRYPLFNNVVLTPPTLTFSPSASKPFTIHGGDLTLELIPAPGHHPDHIAIWIPEIRLLLAFDAVEKPLPLIGDATGVQPMISTLERFIALQPQRVLCSHGKTTDITMAQTNLAYIQEIERRCRQVLAAHRPGAAELEHASTLINYPFDEVLAGSQEPVDRTFYTWAHEKNIRCVMQWLMNFLALME